MSKEKFKVIDIFAGPGGLGEGFSSHGYDRNQSNFKIALSIEKDPVAHQTLLLRSFYRQFKSDSAPADYWDYAKGLISKDELFKKWPLQYKAAAEEARCLELGKASAALVKKLIQERLGTTRKWVLVGGPPCQAYSLVGRSRMKGTRPDFEEDERHFLYKEYLRVLADHKPPVFIMENVKGMLSAQHSGEKIVHKIFGDLRCPEKALGRRGAATEYELFSLTERLSGATAEPAAFLVRAENYGIPQARHRVLILGIRSDIKVTPEALSPVSHSVTVAQTIGDLPPIRSKVSGEDDSLDAWRQIISSVSKEAWYSKGKVNGLSSTVARMEKALGAIKSISLDSGGEALVYRGRPQFKPEWYRQGCEKSGIVMNHAGRGHMASDLQRYFFVSAYGAANGKSVHLGDFPRDLLPAHRNIQKGIKKDHFADRFRVQIATRPSTTITSHISKDGHYFIHPDPSFCRSLTVREAARLQTFPDNYKFEGNRTAQYHQVGNAVPPLLAIQIADIVSKLLERVKF